MSGPEDLKALADRAVAEIGACADDAALEAARIRYLGRKDGEVTQATKQIATLPGKDKPAYGAAVNEAKARIEAALESRGDALHSASIDSSLRERIDLTLPPRPVRELGADHQARLASLGGVGSGRPGTRGPCCTRRKPSAAPPRSP